MTGKTAHGLTVGDVIHIDPRRLPELVIISKEEADKIAAESPAREFVVSWGQPLTEYDPTTE